MLKIILLTLLIRLSMTSSPERLFDFTGDADPLLWSEQSDTVRTGLGLSKAAFVPQSNGAMRRGIFFALLNPQPNGAGFAGMRVFGKYDLSKFNRFIIYGRGQGQFKHFKMVLRHKGQNNEPHYSFEQFFEAPSNFAEISLPLEDFKPYYRGAEVKDKSIVLDTSEITSVGLQYYGGVYVNNLKQSGPATLEIDYIAVA